VPLQLGHACPLFRSPGKIVTQSKKWFAANPEDKQGCHKGESKQVSNESQAESDSFIHDHGILNVVFHG